MISSHIGVAIGVIYNLVVSVTADSSLIYNASFNNSENISASGKRDPYGESFFQERKSFGNDFVETLEGEFDDAYLGFNLVVAARNKQRILISENSEKDKKYYIQEYKEDLKKKISKVTLDYYGKDVNLAASTNGKYLIVSYGETSHTKKGKIEVWSKEDGKWARRGNAINARPFGNDEIALFVAINEDGDTILISTKRKVFIFDWGIDLPDNPIEHWVPRGSYLHPSGKGCVTAISMTPDAKKLAVAQSNPYEVNVYKWDDKKWKKHGNTIKSPHKNGDSAEFTTIALVDDGNMLFAGLSQCGNGEIRAYDYVDDDRRTLTEYNATQKILRGDWDPRWKEESVFKGKNDDELVGSDLAVSINGEVVAWGSKYRAGALMWDNDNDKWRDKGTLAKYKKGDSTDGCYCTVAMDPSGRDLAVGLPNKDIPVGDSKIISDGGKVVTFKRISNNDPCDDDQTTSPTPDEQTTSPTLDEQTTSPTPDEQTTSPTPSDSTTNSPTPLDSTTVSPTPSEDSNLRIANDDTTSPTPEGMSLDEPCEDGETHSPTDSPTPYDHTTSPTRSRERCDEIQGKYDLGFFGLRIAMSKNGIIFTTQNNRITNKVDVLELSASTCKVPKKVARVPHTARSTQLATSSNGNNIIISYNIYMNKDDVTKLKIFFRDRSSDEFKERSFFGQKNRRKEKSFGKSIDISDDGKTIVVASAESLMIFIWRNAQWVEDYRHEVDASGEIVSDVSISRDGKIVAFGTNRPYLVRIIRRSTTKWYPYGNKIYGSELLKSPKNMIEHHITSLELADNGKILFVGMSFYKDRGALFVFDRNDFKDKWVLREGEKNDYIIIGNKIGDRLGFDLTASDNGKVVAWGSETQAGYLVYRNNKWVKSSVDKKMVKLGYQNCLTCKDAPANAREVAVALNGNGDVLAVGTPVYPGSGTTRKGKVTIHDI